MEVVRMLTRRTPLLASAGTREWFPFSWTFQDPDWGEFVRRHMPNLYVSKSRVGIGRNIVLDYDSGTFLFQASMNDDVSPWLKPEVLEAYLLIQWPDVFRRGEDGQAPK